MAINLKENFCKTKSRVKEKKSSLMEIAMRETILKTSLMAMGGSSGPMAHNIMDLGKLANSMVLDTGMINKE